LACKTVSVSRRTYTVLVETFKPCSINQSINRGRTTEHFCFKSTVVRIDCSLHLITLPCDPCLPPFYFCLRFFFSSLRVRTFKKRRNNGMTNTIKCVDFCRCGPVHSKRLGDSQRRPVPNASQAPMSTTDRHTDGCRHRLKPNPIMY